MSDTTNSSSRREFLARSAAVPLALGLASLMGAQATEKPSVQKSTRGKDAKSGSGGSSEVPPAMKGPQSSEHDMREGLTPRRLAVAMWDYSWAYGHYAGGPYGSFDRATDELLERRFNTIRIDAFPMMIGRLKHVDEKVLLPGSPLANWGVSDKDRDHRIAGELFELLEQCQKKSIHVILSSWGQGGFGDVKEGTDFWGHWQRTLDLLIQRKLAENVLYVDFDQEFPYFSPMAKRLNELAQAPAIASASAADSMQAAGRRDQSPSRLAWNPSQMAFVADYFLTTCAHFQKEYPGLRFTFSLTGFWEEVRAMGLKCFDVLELHTWIHGHRFDTRTGFNEQPKDRGNHDYKDYMRRLRETMRSSRPMLMQEMVNRMKTARDWSEEIAAPLVTTEAWGPWWHMDHPDLDWDWLYRWCEECMGLAPRYGFWGATPWNYCHPYWKNWSNVAWYRKVNGAFLES